MPTDGPRDTRSARELGEVIRQRIPTETVYEVIAIGEGIFGTPIPHPTERGPDKQVPRRDWREASKALDELVRRAEAAEAK